MLAHRLRKGVSIATAIGGAVKHLTRGLAMDLAPVRVNAVCPGLILTDQVKKMPEAMLQSMVTPLPVPRATEPSEAAQAYIYLMCIDYATGQIWTVDGSGMMIWEGYTMERTRRHG